MKLNKRLIPIKAHYFFQNGGSAPIAPFIPIIGRDHGFSATVIGIVMTTIPLFSLISKPIVGVIADKFSIHKVIFISLIFVNLVFFFSIQWLPSLPINRNVEVFCEGQQLQFAVETKMAQDDCYVDRLESALNSSIVCQMKCKSSSTLGSLITANITMAENRANTSLFFDILSYSTNDSEHGYFCTSPFKESCDLFSTEPLLQEIVESPSIKGSQVFSQYAFWLFAVLIIVPRVAGSIANSLSDCICFKMLGDRPHDYGYQRMWGAAGWGLVAFITGIIIDKMSEGEYVKNFTAAFYISAVLITIDILIASQLKYTVSVKPPNIFANVKQVLVGNPRFLLYLIIICFCGIFSSLIWNLLFWYIEEVVAENGCGDGKWVKTLEGLTLAVYCYLGEIPFFWISGWMLEHIGHAHCMTIVLLAFGARFGAYYFLTNAWWILPAEVLNGITFGTFYATMTTYANALTPPGMHATLQGFVAAVFEIGVAIGGVSGGFMYDSLGGRTMYGIAAVSSAVLAVLHFLIQSLCGPENTGNRRPEIVPAQREVPPEQEKVEEENW